MQRLNQVIQNFHTKAALIILHSRVDLSPAYSKANTEAKRVNRWFNIELDETDDYRDDIKRWKTCDLKDDRPPPLVIEVFLTTDPLHQGQRLVILDEDGKRWDVQNALSSSHSNRAGKRPVPEANEVILERWTIELGDHSTALPPDLSTVLPLVYKKSIVLFRSLFTYCNFLPAWKLSRKIGKSRSTMAMKIGYRIVDGHFTNSLSRSDNLNLALSSSSNDVTADYTFGVTESPAGPFSVRVTYRHNCDFRIDDSEELLSSRFLGADDDLFRPSMPSEGQEKSRTAQEVGSLPDDRRQHLFERPELGHAYGSLGTFHQAGIATGTSPISALRNAQDFSTGESPPTSEPTRPLSQPQLSRDRESSKSSLRAQAAGRRSSLSFQPFKTPVLSASPLGVSPLGTSPRGHVPVLGSLTEESGLPPPNASALAARKPASLVSEHAVASSTSSSPKPAPVTRYSSSFSHRRARVSSGGTTTKTDEDQTSSGKGSTTSSAQPGSGLMTEAATAGGSSGSMQEDDENIKDFLKLLDTKKDLLSPEEAAAEVSTRRTAAALNKFHRMRDSNAALSDSMSSSLMLHRSSTSSSRQLSSVPPMVAATSASTSSSPGKPTSPHTPHTPFAPSRLSAAYSHGDTDTQHHLQIEEQPPSPSDAATSDTAQARSTTNVPAIDIPNSPRPFLANYRRSSSAQRRPLASDEDIGDLYGMRSASMGAQDRRSARPVTTRSEEPQDLGTGATEPDTTALPRPAASPRLSVSRPHAASAAIPGDGTASDSGSARSSAHHVYRSRLARGGAGRGVTPPQGSTSSFGGAGSADRSGADSESASGSWARGVRRRGSTGRPDMGLHRGDEEGEDEFLPFAMERSDFQSGAAGKSDGKGGS
jgi:autophagy-related protein 13